MDTIQNRQSAKILMFPTAGRTIAANLSRQAKFAAEVAALPAIDLGGAWYHDEAISTTTRESKN